MKNNVVVLRKPKETIKELRRRIKDQEAEIAILEDTCIDLMKRIQRIGKAGTVFWHRDENYWHCYGCGLLWYINSIQNGPIYCPRCGGRILWEAYPND